MKNKLILATTTTLLSAAIAGCATDPSNMAKKTAEETATSVEQILSQSKNMITRPNASKEYDEFFVLGKAFEASPYGALPAFLKQDIVYSLAEPTSLSDIVHDLSKDLDVRIDISNDAISHISVFDNMEAEMTGSQILKENSLSVATEMISDNVAERFGKSMVPGSSLKLNIDHSGTVVTLLNDITNQAGLFWEWKNDHLSIYRTKVKTFQVDATANAISLSSTVSTNRSNSDSAGGSSRTQQSVVENVVYDPYREEISDTIEAMLTESGSLTYAESMGVVTVKDIPPVLDEIEAYITKTNKIINRNVSIRTQIFEITLAENNDVGLDWNALFSGTDSYEVSLGSTFTAGQQPNLTGALLKDGEKFKEAMLALRAENKITDMSTVTDHTTTTKNNQPVPLQIGSEKGYLAEQSTTVEEGITSVSLRPDTVLDGITMSLVPRILSDGTIDMRVGFDLSSVNSITPIRAGDSSESSLIQVTDVTSKSFKNLVNVESGSTTLIAGFEQVKNNSETGSMFGESSWWAGGSKKGGKEKTMNIILLTPYIMK